MNNPRRKTELAAMETGMAGNSRKSVGRFAMECQVEGCGWSNKGSGFVAWHAAMDRANKHIHTADRPVFSHPIKIWREQIWLRE